MSEAPLPADDLERTMAVASAGAAGTRHVSVGGGVYSILLGGEQTRGRYCLIEMRVPHCAGPGPHRHDFEEMFTVLEGTIRFTFRGVETVATAGTTVNIPANAPHFFTNVSGGGARMLCMCAPAGLDEFFLACGDPVASADAAPPSLTDDDKRERVQRARALSSRFRIEMLEP